MYFELRNPWAPDLDDLVPCLWPVQEKIKITPKLAVAAPTWSFEFPSQPFDSYYSFQNPSLGARLVARYQYDGSRYHLLVTVDNALLENVPDKQKIYVLEQFCRAIDYDTLPLLPDTVTELHVCLRQACTEDNDGDGDTHAAAKLAYSPLPKTHLFNPTSQILWVHIREDPTRFLFPQYIGLPNTRRINMSEVSLVEWICASTWTAKIASEGDQLFILKQVKRYCYTPEDTGALLEEFKVLECVGGQGNIVRLIAAVVADNPYQTAAVPDPDEPPVLMGFLIEHHPGGTVEDALKKPEESGNHWVQWGMQLCLAAATMHRHGFAHLDIKPANAVISKDNDLVLIDVGGIGGLTNGWVLPSIDEWYTKCELKDIPLPDRQENDVWGVGKLLVEFSSMAATAGDTHASQLLETLGKQAMDDPAHVSLESLSSILQCVCQ